MRFTLRQPSSPNPAHRDKFRLASLKSPFGRKADVICWPRVLRLVIHTRHTRLFEFWLNLLSRTGF
jgi:hypothetical protein